MPFRGDSRRARICEVYVTLSESVGDARQTEQENTNLFHECCRCRVPKKNTALIPTRASRIAPQATPAVPTTGNFNKSKQRKRRLHEQNLCSLCFLLFNSGWTLLRPRAGRDDFHVVPFHRTESGSEKFRTTWKSSLPRLGSDFKKDFRSGLPGINEIPRLYK